MTLKQVKAHTWLYPHRALFRTSLQDFEAQAKESIVHLAATPMGRSVSAHESHHVSYIPPSSSHLITHTAAKTVSPPSSSQVSKTFDPRRHTVQVEYDRPIPTIRTEEPKQPVIEPTRAKKKPQKDDLELTGLGVPPAPALARSATTGAAAAPRPVVLDTVQEKPPEKAGKTDDVDEKIESPTRRPSGSSSVSGVARPPTARPSMPHGTKPRPTSYHPPSSGAISMTKGRSASGDRTATLLLQRRPSSASSRKVEPSPTAPVSSLQNVEGEILQSTPPPQDSRTLIPTMDKPLGPPPTRTKSHKRGSASISLVADKVLSLFTTTTTRISPVSSPERRPSGTVASESKHGGTVGRTNTTTRRNPFPGSAHGSTVLARRREKSTPSKQSISRSPSENVATTSPKSSRSAVKNNGVAAASPAETIDYVEPPNPHIKRSKTEPQVTLPVVELCSPPQLGIDSPKISKASKKLGELAPEKGSTGRARKVMEFFRRRARGLME